jgi:hypothetical protein
VIEQLDYYRETGAFPRVTPVCGELLIFPESAIRHTQVWKSSNSKRTMRFRRLVPGRVQWQCARPIGTGERSDGEPLRVTSIFSLWASNSVPMPAVGERNVRAEAADIAITSESRAVVGNAAIQRLFICA